MGQNVMKRTYRIYTTQLLEMAEEGMISWESLARAALNYMSEADVKDMAEREEFVPVDEDEDA
jgi:hypothetical protein